jgi:2-C-methyl-D-erythritol 4-phosphate cytidylyltransferase
LKTSAIIVAAGSGVRLGSSVPKAFVKIGGRTMLSCSLVTVRQVSSIDEVVITVPAGFENAARAEVAAAGLAVPVKITPGGIERQDSVRIALELTSAESDLVIVHDAARPLATPASFEACLSAAARTGGAIAAIPVSDTLKRVAERSTRPSRERGYGKHKLHKHFVATCWSRPISAQSVRKSPQPTTPIW